MSQEDTTITEGQEPDVNADDVQPQTDNPTPGGTQITDVATLQRELDEARREAARYRTERGNEKSKVETLERQLKAIGKALGLESEDADADVLTSELDKVKADLRRERMTNRFTRLASEAEADVELLLAFMTYHGELDDLDTEDEGFEQGLKARIEAVLKTNPRLKAPSGVARSGSDFSGTSKPPQKNPWKPESRNLTEQGRILKEDPDLAKQLMREAGVG